MSYLFLMFPDGPLEFLRLILRVLGELQAFLVDVWQLREVIALIIIPVLILFLVYILLRESSPPSLPKEIEKVANLSIEERAKLEANNPSAVVNRLILSAQDCIYLWDDYLVAKQEGPMTPGQERLIADMEAWMEIIPRQYREAKKGNLSNDWKEF